MAFFWACSIGRLFDHVTQQYSRTESINTKIDIEEVTIERIPALRCPLMPCNYSGLVMLFHDDHQYNDVKMGL